MGSSARASASSEGARRRGLRRGLAIAALGVAAASVVACEDVLEDPTFRLWCGDTLCAWRLEEGSVRRAATWHEDDHGVELVDVPTTLSQDVDKSPRCLEFTMVADVDPSAQVTIALDFNRDGTIDFEQPIPAAKWRPVKTVVTAPRVYDGIRFRIRKGGAGRAVLAQLRVQAGSGCGGPPVALRDQPLGTPCGAGAAECRSGICCDGLCAECCSPPGPVLETLEDGGAALPPERPCATGTCASRAVPSSRGFFLPAMPRQCDPGKMAKSAGAECVADDDCASGVCEGVVVRASRTSATDPMDAQACEADLPDAGGDRCVVLAVRGGRCR